MTNFNEKIKIGYFGSRGLPASYGGFETIADQLDKRLDRTIFDFIVTKSKNDLNLRYEIREYGNNNTRQVFYRPSLFWKINKSIGKVVDEALVLKDGCKKNFWKLNVILQCGSTPGIFLNRTMKNKFSPIILWNPDGLEWRRTKFAWYERAALYYETKRGLSFADAVIVDSLEIGKYFNRWTYNKLKYYLPGGTEIVDPKLIDLSVLGEYKINKYDYYLIVARVAPENNILEMIKWFLQSKSKKKLVLLLNIDNDKYSNDILKIIEKEKEKIIYRGAEYNKRKVYALRYFAYAYFHGHSVGGTNPSLLESLGSACPPICFDVPFNREVARDAGLYFIDRDSFINCIDKIEKSFSFRQSLSEKAKNVAVEDYSWDFITNLHEAVFLHSLAYFNKIERSKYIEWLRSNKYYGKLNKRGYDNFDKIDIR